jgi:Icc-related predicted phosphoesterase
MPPKADILIHAGDYTKFGNKGHAVDFNEWLGTLPYKTKIVVSGNHECNAEWHRTAKSLLSNATLLIDEGIEVEVECEAEAGAEAEVGAEAKDALINTADDKGYDHHKDNRNISNNISNGNNKKKLIKIYGTNFYWPCMDKSIPSYFDSINLKSIDILITHCPVEGYVDSNQGCPSLLRVIQDQMLAIQQEQQHQHQEKIVICGHMHSARGIVKDEDLGVTFVNAANARGGIKGGHVVGRQPIVLTL